ncbi:MAG: hypothetical protein PSX36_12735 [bacterium]|nr:hypothetical protein [bacterium]
MKSLLISAITCTLILTSCESSQKIIASWVNRDHFPKEPPASIFVLALASNDDNRFTIENLVGDLLTKRGRTVVKSSELMPARIAGLKITQAQFDKIVKDHGCTAVITLSLLDTKTIQHYVSSSVAYVPYNYGYNGGTNSGGGYYGNLNSNNYGNNYGGYYGYYSYYSAQVYSPGYYSVDKTYYVETNFYDMVNDYMLWSIQSSATNPKNFTAWFPKFSNLILAQLKKDGLIKS